MLLLCISLITIPMISYADFSDVAKEHWAYEYINVLTEKKVINGFEDGTFRPSDTLTKGQFLKLILTASIRDEEEINEAEKKFEHWAGGFVTLAEKYEVIDENSITIDNIDEPINRIDVICILSKCDMRIKNHEQRLDGMIDYRFTDVEDLDEVQRYMLLHANNSFYIQGYEDGSFKPKNNLTRAEVAKIIAVYTGSISQNTNENDSLENEEDVSYVEDKSYVIDTSGEEDFSDSIIIEVGE